MNKKKDISKKNLDIWNKYIKNPTDIIDKDSFEFKKVFQKKRFKFDLHGFNLDDANKKVREIILLCSQKNFKEILLITGKGIHSNTNKDVYVSNKLSKLRFSVPEYISNNLELSNRVVSIKNASKTDGGEGAIIIKLKSLQNKF